MIEIVINYDSATNSYKVYEPTTETLLVTSSLAESLVKLSEFLKTKGMIIDDILKASNITYHLDAKTFNAMVESNVKLLKRLSTAQSGFTNSSQKFGNGNTGSTYKKNKGFSSTDSRQSNIKFKNDSFFSKSSFKNSSKKFGNG